MVIISICLHTLCLVAWVWDGELGGHWEITYIARIYCIFQGTLVPWNTTLVFTEFCAYCQFLVFKWWLCRGKALDAVCLVRLYYMLHMFCVSMGSQPWLLQSAVWVSSVSPRQLLTHSTSSRIGRSIGRKGVRKLVDWDIATCANKRKSKKLIHCFPAQECRAPAQVIVTKAKVSTSLLLPCPSSIIYW